MSGLPIIPESPIECTSCHHEFVFNEDDVYEGASPNGEFEDCIDCPVCQKKVVL